MTRAVALLIVLASAPAFAQHDHAADDHEEHASPSAVAAGVSLVAATFDTMLYAGNYEGIVPSVRWSSSRVAAIASASAYRLVKNGAELYGPGDVSVYGQAVIVRTDTFDAGVLAGISLPTANAQRGLGMGHVMVMPGLFAAWTHERVRLAASLGYSRALGAEGHHDHGAWPLVSPMLVSEVSWNAGTDVRVTPRVSAGARASGGVPADGEGGGARAIVAGRVAWRAGRVDSALELQTGVVGDPFTVRGVVSSALTF